MNQLAEPCALLLVAAALMSGCAFRPNGQLQVGGIERTYTLHTPKGYDPGEGPMPLVFVLHGNPSRGWQMQLYTGMSKTADEEGFIVVYPDGLDNVWRFDDCNRVAQDVAFIEALLTHLTNTYEVDERRIYFAGISGGSLFLSALVHAMPERIAAIGKVAAGTARADRICGVSEKNEQLPVMLIFGTEDFLYNGVKERGILSAAETVDYWTKRNDCGSQPAVKNLPDLVKKDHSSVTTLQYLASNGTEVLFYRIEGGGHHWPNSRFNASTFYKKRNLGHLNKDFNTNQVLWDFFSRHQSD